MPGSIPTHFHIDCLGGLAAFHERNIPSWAHERTRSLAADSNMVVPQNGFEEKKIFQLGSETVRAEFNGEGHTRCNITAYYPPENVLFGGCLVKSLNAGKGNLADANVPAWPETMRTIKQKYPELEVVIPGHGPVGGVKLLDYTARLFAATR